MEHYYLAVYCVSNSSSIYAIEMFFTYEWLDI